MNPVKNLIKSLKEKNCVKIIAGIDNYDVKNILKVIIAANKGGADAIDVAAREDIIKLAKENTDLAVFVSSTEPEKLLAAKENGADVLEIGNFDAYYKKGQRITAEEVLKITEKTIELVGNEIMICVTVPGHIEISEQIKLAQKLEEMGVDLIQTEGAATVQAKSPGARGLMEKAVVSISNTVELCKNIEIPVMTASGITSTTASMAFAAGASAIGVGSCVNKLGSEIEMIATVRSIVETVKKESFSTQKSLI
ncbi:MAG TPA: DUF561 domain-containing protein [Candidatus Gastranaerophilales bacterium]|nr:DUF561 domain-containing protein [Candidatus Gastranaerophilales bacterium]